MSDNHRAEVFRVDDHTTVGQSMDCGCIYCCRIFPPSAMVEWVGQDGREPLCPYCSTDALLGSAVLGTITVERLRDLHASAF